MEYEAELVWGSACAAYRINRGYIKTNKWPDSQPEGEVGNKVLMKQLLLTPEKIIEEDLELGRKVRGVFQMLIFDVLKNKNMSEYQKNAMRISGLDTITEEYDFAIIASLYDTYIRKKLRQSAEQRVAFAHGPMVGNIDDKVVMNIEVLNSLYSQQWNTCYITAISDQDQAVFFALKNGVATGSKITIIGNVKGIRSCNMTQLNRVKVKETI
jgi:hypothetical protein